jgi:proteasome lid subunit RPN8/RPN11
VLDPADEQALRAHAERCYPEECCGILIGSRAAVETHVQGLVATENSAQAADRRHRFSIAPEELLATHRAAEAAGLEIVGYYHSHPDCHAEPSEHDRNSAWPGTSYVIVEVHAGGAGRARSWRLSQDYAAFYEETIELSGSR